MTDWDDDDPFRIPEWLKIPAQERKASWVGVPLTNARGRGRSGDYDLPKSMDATARAILKEERKAKEAKKAARLARLKELRNR